MTCAIRLFPMAHQWRKPVCAINEKRLVEKLMAQGRAIGAFFNGAQWRIPLRRLVSAPPLGASLAGRSLPALQTTTNREGTEQ
jgi:hypothetical protein